MPPQPFHDYIDYLKLRPGIIGGLTECCDTILAIATWIDLSPSSSLVELGRTSSGSVCARTLELCKSSDLNHNKVYGTRTWKIESRFWRLICNILAIKRVWGPGTALGNMYPHGIKGGGVTRLHHLYNSCHQWEALLGGSLPWRWNCCSFFFFRSIGWCGFTSLGIFFFLIKDLSQAVSCLFFTILDTFLWNGRGAM